MGVSTCTLCLHTASVAVSTCPMCLNDVGNVLAKKPKVSHAENQLSESYATISYLNLMALPSKTPPFALMTATLVAAGYLVVPPSGVAAGYSITPPSYIKLPAPSESADVAPTLESICRVEKGSSEKRKAELAQILDTVFKHVMSRAKHKSHHAAACVAVYKLAIMLGKVQGNDNVKASEWRRILKGRYDVFISEGIAKYNIKNPKSNVFKKAVLDAYSFISDNYPVWVLKKNLPAIYQ
jgi:hypothetical protein